MKIAQDGRHARANTFRSLVLTYHRLAELRRRHHLAGNERLSPHEGKADSITCPDNKRSRQTMKAKVATKISKGLSSAYIRSKRIARPLAVNTDANTFLGLRLKKIWKTDFSVAMRYSRWLV